MRIPYRTRRALRRLAIGICILAVLVVLAGLLWILWVSRFVVYTREQGVILDFEQSDQNMTGELAVPPTQGETIEVYYNTGEGAVAVSKELSQMMGYYISAEVLEDDISVVLAQLQALPEGTPVMIDVKSIKGNFFYSSSVGSPRNEDLDIDAMDALLAYLKKSNFYTIARMPALRDFYYGLEHVSDGLPMPGGYLWIDSSSCYWLNPASDGTRTYLVQIIRELQALGFDEVVLSDFKFPETDQIVYTADKAQVLADTAKFLVDTCATDRFAVSFIGEPGFVLPEGRSRLYLQDVPAVQAASKAQATGIEDTAVRVVFLTNVHDTRFNVFSVLRPLSGAH